MRTKDMTSRILLSLVSTSVVLFFAGILAWIGDGVELFFYYTIGVITAIGVITTEAFMILKYWRKNKRK